MRISDWSSDVCSSDLHHGERIEPVPLRLVLHGGAKSFSKISCPSPWAGSHLWGIAMHWIKFSLVGVAAIAAPAFASPIQWTISEASSGVTVSHQGSSKPAVRGEKVQTGDKLITGPNARAVLVRGAKDGKRVVQGRRGEERGDVGG